MEPQGWEKQWQLSSDMLTIQFPFSNALFAYNCSQKRMFGEEIARYTIGSIQHKLQSHLAAMHNQAACNGVALQTFKIVSHTCKYRMLLSHTRSCWIKTFHSNSKLCYSLVDQFIQPQPKDDATLEGENWSSLSVLLCNK